MAIAKITTSSDIVIKMGTVMTGAGTPLQRDFYSGDNATRWASGDSLGWVQNLDNRFKFRVGGDGSGNWEH